MKMFLTLSLIAVMSLRLMSFTEPPQMDQFEYSASFTENINGFNTITVYKITIVGQSGAASKQSFSAEFDKEKMELRVVEKRNGKNYTMTYSVVRNPYKGYKDDPRGSYDYCASGYYFN